MQKVIVIIGATATKKSTLAYQIAKAIDAEIISADAYQVYKEMNIGINKISKYCRQIVPHHFIDCISIYDKYDIKIFQHQAREKINEIIARKKKVIITGGSNLYLEALIKNYDLTKAHEREQVHFFDNMEYDDIYQYLIRNDYDEAIKIGYNNKRRIIRAAQLFYETKKTKLQQNKNCQYVYDILFINTFLPRSILYDKINQRTIKMINNKWMNEVVKLYQNNHEIKKLQAFKAIGYQQILDSYLANEVVDVEKIQRITRNYAKRQITWNKRYNAIQVNVNDFDFNDLINQIKQFYMEQ